MLSREEIFSGLKEILVSMDPSKEEAMSKVNESTKLVEDLGLMSVSLLYMVISIEERFNIDLGNVGVNDFHTVGDVIAYIQKVSE